MNELSRRCAFLFPPSRASAHMTLGDGGGDLGSLRLFGQTPKSKPSIHDKARPICQAGPTVRYHQ